MAISTYVYVSLALTACKILLFCAYRSTDFEVHRNWLAITHSLPIAKWYYEDTSEWTLDYPPVFAWFEWLLAKAAARVDPEMLVIENLEYDSFTTVAFQRSTVIITDVVLLLAAYLIARRQASHAAGVVTFCLTAANVGLLMVDHIHFQYNGVMLGLLLLSVWAIQEGRPVLGGTLFAALVNMKHLFAYLGPVYLVFLLRSHVWQRGSSFGAALGRLAVLGGCVVAVCAASFGPFIALGQLKQVLARLFPFGRGLTHAYWAANAWALYCFADKVLAAVLPRLGVAVQVPEGNLAGGVVGVQEFAVLPAVGAGVTAACVLLALLPCLVSLWRAPGRERLPAAVAYAALCGFMFGYHVHEKAVIVALVPLGAVALRSAKQAADFLLLAAAGCYGILPLLHEVQEYPIKICALVAFLTMAYLGIDHVLGAQGQAAGREKAAGASGSSKQGKGAGGSGGWWPWQYALYCWGLVALELFNSFVHPATEMGSLLPFLPLLLTSVYCALGVSWVWLRMCGGYALHR